jgi:hypothetical protein
MKTALFVMLSCATFSLAQDMKIAPPAAPSDGDAQQQYKRLASVTWDLDTHKLVWVVQKGIEVNGQFVPKSTDRYEVSPNEAFMAQKDEKRGIETDEAKSLHDLLGVLSLYCVESTVWWENGGGQGDADRLADPSEQPATSPSDSKPADANPGKKIGDGKATPVPDPNAKPTHVDQPATKKPAPVQLIPGAFIAANDAVK